MEKCLIIWRRELTACFLSPVAYVTLVAFLAVTGFTFWVAAFRNVGRPEPLALLLCGCLVFWLPILVTVVAMRLFVEEKQSGTIELLLTAPVTEAQIVLGKYAGALTFLLIAVLPPVSSVFVLERISPTVTLANLDLGALVSGEVITVLVTAAFLALAMVVSLSTRNQIVAAMCTFCTLWLALLGGWLLSETPGVPQAFADAVSITRHIETFARGVIEVGPIVLYASVCVGMLFTATRMLESRRWR